MGVLAVVAAVSLDKRLVDPDGFLGPSWLRLPLLLGSAPSSLDLLPAHAVALAVPAGADARRSSRSGCAPTGPATGSPSSCSGSRRFYITYVSYRNLKSFLPFVLGRDSTTASCTCSTGRCSSGTSPRRCCTRSSATAVSRALLSTIYLWFLPLVPLALTAWVVWSRNISYGYWFVTSQCIAWTLGTASYYALPTLGPGLRVPLALRGPAGHGVDAADGVAVVRAPGRLLRRATRAPCSRWPASRACTSRSPCWWR